ncbi:hypothetical protein B0T19DRAFT_481222, partial [Cercophora scortea]
MVTTTTLAVPKPDFSSKLAAEWAARYKSRVSEYATVQHGAHPKAEGRRPVDLEFLYFLVQYMDEPECPILFREYLREEVLNPDKDVNDFLKHLELCLRNWDVKKYKLGPHFMRKLKEYKLYDLLYPVDGKYHGLPVKKIPEMFIPKYKGQSLGPKQGEAPADGALFSPPSGMKEGPSLVDGKVDGK